MFYFIFFYFSASLYHNQSIWTHQPRFSPTWRKYKCRLTKAIKSWRPLQAKLFTSAVKLFRLPVWVFNLQFPFSFWIFNIGPLLPQTGNFPWPSMRLHSLSLGGTARLETGPVPAHLFPLVSSSRRSTLSTPWAAVVR